MHYNSKHIYMHRHTRTLTTYTTSSTDTHTDTQTERQSMRSINPFLRRASTSSTFIPKMKMLSSPISSIISTLAPSSVPMVSEPFNYQPQQQTLHTTTHSRQLNTLRHGLQLTNCTVTETSKYPANVINVAKLGKHNKCS